MIGPPVGGALFEVTYVYRWLSRVLITYGRYNKFCQLCLSYPSDFVSNKTWIAMTSPSLFQISPLDMLLESAINLLFYFVTLIPDISFPADLVSFTSAHTNSGYYWLLLHPFRARRIWFNWRRDRIRSNLLRSLKKEAPPWCKRSNWVGSVIRRYMRRQSLGDRCLSVCLSVCPVCLWRWCVVVKRLDGSRWKSAWR